MTVDFWTYGTGGPLMWAAIGLTLFALVFGYLVKKWSDALVEVPLNYIAEPRYRTPKPYSGPTNDFSVFAATATSAYAAFWPVVDPREVVEYKCNLERVAWLPEAGS